MTELLLPIVVLGWLALLQPIRGLSMGAMK
jgi:hypothetical protein